MNRILFLTLVATFVALYASANMVACSFHGQTMKETAPRVEGYEQWGRVGTLDSYVKGEIREKVKAKTALPIDVMALVTYQAKGNVGVERYLLEHGFKYKGRFVPDDLNPDFYYQKKYSKGCSVNKKGVVVSHDAQGCLVEICSVGFGPCTVISFFDKDKWLAVLSILKSKGLKEIASADTDSSTDYSLVKDKMRVDFWHEAKGVWGLTIWRDGWEE